MKSEIQNLDGIVDQSLATASRIITIVAFPALLIAGYRNLFIDYLPYHQTFLSICFGLFVFLGFGKIKSSQIRVFTLVAIFFSIFIFSGLRNSSIIFVGPFLVLACGLMAFKFSGLYVLMSGTLATLVLFLLIEETFLPEGEDSFSVLAVYLTSMALICILVFGIRKVVEQYEQIYLKEIAYRGPA